MSSRPPLPPALRVAFLLVPGAVMSMRLAVTNDNDLEARIADAVTRILPADELEWPQAQGYVLKRKASCRARTMDQGIMTGDAAEDSSDESSTVSSEDDAERDAEDDASEDFSQESSTVSSEGDTLEDSVDECRKRCEWKPLCQCFEVSPGGRCRIAISKGERTKKGGQGAAYVRDKKYVNPDEVCKRGVHHRVDGTCGDYFVCEKGDFVKYSCPNGLAFDNVAGKCTWPTAIPECASTALHGLPIVSCNGQELLLAEGKDAAMQQWIQLEMDRWWEKVGKNPSVYQRPEGRAAASILRTTGIEVTTKKNGTSDVTTSRWAVFSHDARGLLMQAVALVEEDTTDEKENRVNVMAVVSRRSLLDDKIYARSAGKALLSGILSTVHRENPDAQGNPKALTLLGTPGDAFVEKMYRSHGMQEYGREETGMPKLKVSYPPECVKFVTATILCQETSLPVYASIAWRMAPGSGSIKETCAHVLSREQYLKQMLKSVGVRF